MTLSRILIAVLLAGICFFAWRFMLTRRRLNEVLSGNKDTAQSSEDHRQKIEEEKNRILAVLGSMAEGVAVIDSQNRVILAN